MTSTTSANDQQRAILQRPVWTREVQRRTGDNGVAVEKVVYSTGVRWRGSVPGAPGVDLWITEADHGKGWDLTVAGLDATGPKTTNEGNRYKAAKAAADLLRSLCRWTGPIDFTAFNIDQPLDQHTA